MLGAITIASCTRNEEITGCTDHLAENHNPRATVDDGSCTYPPDEQVIWKDGVAGGWNGDIFSYGIVPELCYGMLVFDADTSAQTHLTRLITDVNGDLQLQFKLINPVSASNYIEGNLRIDLALPEGVSLPLVDIYIHGKIADSDGVCPGYVRSDFVQVSTQALGQTPHALSIPLRDFEQMRLGDIEVMVGIEIKNAQPNSEVLWINNVRWTRA